MRVHHQAADTRVGCVCLTSSASVDGRVILEPRPRLSCSVPACFSTPATHPLGAGSLAPPPPEGPCQPPLSPSWRLTRPEGRAGEGESLAAARTRRSGGFGVKRQNRGKWCFKKKKKKMNQHNKSGQQLLLSSAQSSRVSTEPRLRH